MLPPQHRLRHSADFQVTIRSGKRAGGRYVVLHVLTESTRGSRVGFVVSRAIGNAVTRNLVKRRLRNIMRELLPELNTSADVVVRALPRSSRANFVDLSKDLRTGLQRVGVLD